MADEKKERPAYNYRTFLRAPAPTDDGNVWFYEPGEAGPTLSCGYCHGKVVAKLTDVTAFGEVDQKPCEGGPIPVKLQDWDAGRGVIIVVKLPEEEAAPQ